MKGAVSSGHPLTTQAALRILEQGGNAFDAIVAAGFACSVCESVYGTLGGGGFILGHHFDQKREIFYDFFVDTPGKGLEQMPPQKLIPIDVCFSSAVQVFHIGMGSIAVPGTLKGLIHCYMENCTMDLDDILAPAIEYLTEGVELTPSQEHIIRIVKPILDISDYGREIFPLNKRSRLYNPLLKTFLERRSIDDWLDICYYGNGTAAFLEDIKKGDGRITKHDLDGYVVVERTPLTIDYRGCQIVTNPPPSFGGPMIGLALSILSNETFAGKNTIEKALMRARVLRKMNQLKGAGGTTHLNVIDANNNAVGMSLSAGTSSGYFYPETGILMNNMMGESDLHPGDFYSGRPGDRVPSMMAPTFIKKQGKIIASLGTGGSSRIRSAILQVVMNLVDEGMSVEEAVESSRMHFDDDGVLQIEPLFSKEVLEALKKEYPEINVWSDKDLYFGGVHTVMGNLDGWGDSRRNGCYQILE